MKSILLSLILLTSVVVKAQLFTKLYSPSQPLVGLDVKATDQTADMGYVILAQDDFALQGYIIRLNSNGDTLWVRDFFMNSSSELGSIEELPDGGYIMSQCYIGFYQKVTRLNSAGSEIWTRLISKSGDTNVSEETGVRYDPTSGSAYEFVAYCGLGTSQVPSITKLNASGSFIWTRIFSDIFGALNQVSMTDLAVTSTGNVVSVFNGSASNYICRLNGSTGAVTTLLGTDMVMNTVQESTFSGDILIGGAIPDVFSNFDAGLLILDPNSLAEVENKSFGSSNFEAVMSIVENSDGTIALGVQDNSTGNSKMGIYKLNGSNSLDWSIAYGGNSTDLLQGIYQKSDGGFVAIGSSSSFTSSEDMLIVATDQMGITIGCQEALPYTVISNNQFTLSNVTPQNLSISYLNLSNSLGLGPAASINITNPAPSTSIISTDPVCNGATGSADLVVSGGGVPYIYNWSSGTSAEDLAGVLAGSYSVSVEDNNGCIVHDTTTLIDPAAITSSISSLPVTCSGNSDGSVDLTVSGGTPNYTYQWSYNNTATQDLNAVPGGFYFVTITDANGCTASQSVSVNEPNALISGVSAATDPLCAGDCNGSIATSVAGGTSPYTYLWNDPSAQTIGTATNLCAGSYLVTISDANGCSTFSSASLQDPSQLTVSIVTTQSECGLQDGAATAMPAGGTSPYSFNWPAGSTLNNETGIGVGAYSMTVTDANGCSQNAAYTIDPFVQQVNICIVTVDSSSVYNKVVWDKPTAANIEGFNVYRNVAGVYNQVGHVPYTDLSQYIDLSFGVNPNITSYRYKISTVDTCGNESDLSGFHETIHVTSSTGAGNQVNLIWDNYEGFSFVNYDIYKDTTNNGIDDFFLADQLTSNNFTWTDINPANYSEYIVVVVAPSLCSATQKATDYNSSRSNKSYSTFDPGNTNSIDERDGFDLTLFPNPSNGQFKLKSNGQNVGDIRLEIMDQTGRLINEVEQFQLVGGQLIDFDLSNFPSGTYLMRIISEDKIELKPFTILNN